jgi:hypothetical protein
MFYSHLENNYITMPRARASVVGLKMVNDDNGEKREPRTDASFMKTCGCNAHDAMMNATNK